MRNARIVPGLERWRGPGRQVENDQVRAAMEHDVQAFPQGRGGGDVEGAALMAARMAGA